jgi:F420-non-reducing hydrogenase small subunit
MLRLAWDMLAGCSGCEMALLDIGEPLLELLPALNLVHMPILQDPTWGHEDNGLSVSIPEADVGLLSGCIRTVEQAGLAEEMRRQCEVLVALGTCACTGGISALANLLLSVDALVIPDQSSAFSGTPLASFSDTPELTGQVYALDEVVRVDIKLPGCPPTPELLAEAITALVNGQAIASNEHSVCDDCPTQRLGNMMAPARHPFVVADRERGQAISQMRCLLEQGFLCLGPVTRTGCGGMAKTPCCIQAYMPCRGCFGPIRSSSNPMADMLGGLISLGFDVHHIKDRLATFYRYSGLTGKGRPLVRARPMR